MPFADEKTEPDFEAVVVQPDLFVACDGQIRDEYVSGVPALVIEILSQSTVKLNKVRKRAIYERIGVPEYWIVDPTHETVDVYRLHGGIYAIPETFGPDDNIASAIGATHPVFTMNLYVRHERIRRL